MTQYLDNSKNIFILGIKGVGMANLAVILKQMGKHVFGSDVEEEFITEELLAANEIDVITDFEPGDLPENVDLFVYSGANKGTQNPQALEAKRRGVPLIAQTGLLGELMQKFQNSVAVCGCHGKTTTAALLAYAFEKLGVDPSFFIGTSMFQDKWAGEYDEQKFFVVEADEYGIDPPLDKTPKFLLLQPTHILCLNVDWDHADIYKDIDATKRAFYTFFTKAPPRKLLLNEDNPELMDSVKNLPRTSYTTFGFASSSDYRIVKPVIEEFHSQFEIVTKTGVRLGEFQIALFGMQNISNAAGVVALLHSFGFQAEQIQHAVRNFSGVKRRFEKLSEENDILFFDDYAHHPEEITQTILSAKARFKDRRVIVIFQPHTYSRTEALKEDFVTALSTADYSIIAPIYASARENNPEEHITSEDLVDLALTKGYKNITSFRRKEELSYLLQSILKKEDVVFTMGAGDIYKMKNDIIEVMKLISS